MEEACHGEDDTNGRHTEHHRRCQQIEPYYPRSSLLARMHIVGARWILTVLAGLIVSSPI